MKNLSALIAFFVISSMLTAQITITRDDMPDVGDTTRLSLAAILPGTDPSATGPDYVWDFSMLEPQSQVVEGYVSTQSTPFIYQIIFNAGVANLASPLQSLEFLPEFEVTDAYIFYKESTANYVRAGYAATIMGIPVPMKFDYPELLYTFPLNYASPKDSSLSAYSLELPGIGFFSIERKRVNQADGWGSVTTPYGTFDALRIKSEVYESDSLYVDSLQVGFPVNRYYTEYNWLANGYGIPVLSITQEGPLVTARYIDTIQNLTPLTVTLGPELTVCRGDTVTLEAVVSGGTPPYRYLWNTMDTTAVIKVVPADTTIYSVLVTDAENNAMFAGVTVNVSAFKEVDLGADTLQICAGASVLFDAGEGYANVSWFINGTLAGQGQMIEVDSTGIGLNNATLRVEYLMNGCAGNDELEINFYICGGIDSPQPVLLNVSPNPVTDLMAISNNRFSSKATVIIVSPSGQLIRPSVRTGDNGSILVDTGKLEAGNYLLIVRQGPITGTAKFIRR